MLMECGLSVLYCLFQIAAKINPGTSPVGQKRPLEGDMDSLGMCVILFTLSCGVFVAGSGPRCYTVDDIRMSVY